MTVCDDDELEVLLDLWGALLYEARRKRKLSQPALARVAGAAQQTISKVERGLVCPHDRLKLRLATALEIDPAILFPWPSLEELAYMRDNPTIDK